MEECSAVKCSGVEWSGVEMKSHHTTPHTIGSLTSENNMDKILKKSLIF